MAWLLGAIWVAIAWGVSTPYLKKGAEGLSQIKEDHFLKQILKEWVYLLTRWQVRHFLMS
jgi:hypothetical protein